MLLKVTKEDIRKGVRRSPQCCPIGNALIRRGFDWVSVKPNTLGVGYRNGQESCIELPPEAVAFIERFDNCKPVKPITFRIPLQPPRRKEGRK